MAFYGALSKSRLQWPESNFRNRKDAKLNLYGRYEPGLVGIRYLPFIIGYGSQKSQNFLSKSLKNEVRLFRKTLHFS